MDRKVSVSYSSLHLIARQLLFRSFLLASAISVVSLFHFIPNLSSSFSYNTHFHCLSQQPQPLSPGSYLFQSRILNSFWASLTYECPKDSNFTLPLVKQLMGKGLLGFSDTCLCLGPEHASAVSAMAHLGFTTVTGAHHPINHRGLPWNLHYQDYSFDFVFSKDVDKVSVPALLVLEVERILKPGGVAALLVGPTAPPNPNHSTSSAAKISSLLRSSTLVHVGHVNGHSLVVFKKRFENKWETADVQ